MEGTATDSEPVPWPGFSCVSPCFFFFGGGGVGLSLPGLLGFKLRKTAPRFLLGSKLLCFWFSVDGFLVCSHITFPFSFSLFVFFLHLSLFVSLLRTAMISRRSRPFRQLGLGLLLLGCLPLCLGLRPRNLPTSLGYFAFLFLVCFRCVIFFCFSGGQPR